MINADGSTIYELNKKGVNRWSANIQPGKDDEGNKVSEKELCEIATAFSAFGDLYSSTELALKAIEKLAEEHGAIPGYLDDITSVLEASLAKARGEQP